MPRNTVTRPFVRPRSTQLKTNVLMIPVRTSTAKTLVSEDRSTLIALALRAIAVPFRTQKMAKPTAPVFSQTQRMLWCGM